MVYDIKTASRFIPVHYFPELLPKHRIKFLSNFNLQKLVLKQEAQSACLRLYLPYPHASRNTCQYPTAVEDIVLE